MRLSDVISSRDNNFNLIRLIAAWMVLVSHSHVIVTGDPMREPLASWIGMTPGSIAVDIFFFSSGLLVTSSLVRRHDVGRFLLARAARIYPAMWAMTLLTVLFFGCVIAQTSLLQFILDAETRTYLWKNSTIAWGITGNLPGIFPDQAVPRGVNGSLWTLKFEVWMYGILALLGLLSKPLSARGLKVLPLLCILMALAGLAQHLRIYLTEHVVDERYRLLSIFFLGSAAFHLRNWLTLDWRVLGALALLTVLTLDRPDALRCVYPFFIGYGVLVLAYRPKGQILNFNRYGDFSYGLYIYAFPVQKTLAHVFPTLTIPQHIVFSTLVTGSIAMASWFLVEKPALEWARGTKAA